MYLCICVLCICIISCNMLLFGTASRWWRQVEQWTVQRQLENRKLQPLLPAWTPTILTWELIWTQLISQTLYFRLSLTIFTIPTIFTFFTMLCFSPNGQHKRSYLDNTSFTLLNPFQQNQHYHWYHNIGLLNMWQQWWNSSEISLWICCFTAAAFLFIRMDPTAGELEPFWSRRGKCSRVIKRLDSFSRHIESHIFVRFVN